MKTLKDYQEEYEALKGAVSSFEENLPSNFSIEDGQVVESRQEFGFKLGLDEEGDIFSIFHTIKVKNRDLFLQDLKTLVTGLYVESDLTERLKTQLVLDTIEKIKKPNESTFVSVEFKEAFNNLKEIKSAYSKVLANLILEEIGELATTWNYNSILTAILYDGVQQSVLSQTDLQRVEFLRTETSALKEKTHYKLEFGLFSKKEY